MFSVLLLAGAWILMLVGGFVAADSFLPKSNGAPSVWPELLLGVIVLSIGWCIRNLTLRVVRASAHSSRPGTVDHSTRQPRF